MARFIYKLPDIGEGIAEAEIVAWHVTVGDIVDEDSPIADMMTDKATVEIESPVAGRVIEVAGNIGDQVAIGAALVVIETDNDAEAEEIGDKHFPADQFVESGTSSGILQPSELAETPAAPEIPSRRNPLSAAARPKSAATGNDDGDRIEVLASPAVRLRAKQLGVDISDIRAAAGGRVRHADLDAFLRYSSRQGYHAPNADRPREDEAVAVVGMRRRIAENMAASKRHIPHFTYVDECDVTQLEALRADLNNHRGSKPKLTLLPLLIVAICRTLPDFPMLNARYDDEAGVVTRSGRVHMGMATQTDAGLTVPVIRDAQDQNIWQLAAEITRLAQAARINKLAPHEMGKGTITITSLGPLGGVATTPVINRPEVAIIGPNKIVERPMFVENGNSGELRRAKLMNISISCDHRVVDGWDAASYIQALKHFLETPVLLFAPEDAYR